ncbi:MAG: FAD:protein FMN transferase [Saprospiraceae bacterium]|nr:FAD:protein FMN transferase [Saprospiraceae bacterium]
MTDQVTKPSISHSKSLKLMGNQFELTAVHESLEVCKQAVEIGILEVRRIEALLSTFSEDSITASINKNAGVSPIQVPVEVFYLIERCQRISNLTQGAFDITYGSVDKKYWNFDTKMAQLPDPKIAKKAVKLVDYRNLVLDAQEKTVFLKYKGMRIGFGGIGKGYAAEMAKKVMISKGVERGVVNAAGDLTAWGNQINGRPWTIGIADPNHKQNLFSQFEISNKSVATSGDYEKYVIIDGKRYSHTIDPVTGMPAQGLKSVTILCQNAELADALTTPLIVMGRDAGLHMINQLNGVEAIIIDQNDKIYYSKNVKINK